MDQLVVKNRLAFLAFCSVLLTWHEDIYTHNTNTTHYALFLFLTHSLAHLSFSLS